MKDLIRALHFAASMHGTQRRKDRAQTPYINHPIDVVRILSEVGGVSDEAVLMGAALHDTVEDTAATHEELVELFGDQVAGYVAEVSDDKSLPKDERKQLQVDKAATKSHGAKLIKLGDKISNVSDLVDNAPDTWPTDRVVAYGRWAKQVVDELRGTNAELERHFDDCLRRLEASSGH